MIGAILDSLKGELDLIFKIEISLFVLKIPCQNANASSRGLKGVH